MNVEKIEQTDSVEEPRIEQKARGFKLQLSQLSSGSILFLFFLHSSYVNKLCQISFTHPLGGQTSWKT